MIRNSTSLTIFLCSSQFQFGRYSFLALGIAYGAYHQGRLSKREVKIREIEAEQKVIRDAKLAIEKKRMVAGKSSNGNP